MTKLDAIQAVRGTTSGRSICLVIASLGAGGAERVAAWLAGHWLAVSARVTLVAFDRESDPIYHAFPAQVRFVRLGIAAGGRATPLRRIAALRGVLRRERPDLTVSFLTKINVLALAAATGLDVPIVVAERNNPERQPTHRLWAMALSRLYRRAAAIVCQTEASIRCIPPPCRGRVHVIPNPVTPPATVRSPIPPRVLTGVGRLEAQKGFDLLIDAFAKIAGRHPDWTLEIWGDGPAAEPLRAQAATRGLAGRVTLRGLSEHPGGWIASTGIFVLASRYEGFPNVLGEAMAAGLPVIATNCDFGPAELVADGETGLLVATEDGTALAGALDRLMADAVLRERLAEAAPSVSLRFAPTRIAAAWDALAAAVFAGQVSSAS